MYLWAMDIRAVQYGGRNTMRDRGMVNWGADSKNP